MQAHSARGRYLGCVYSFSRSPRPRRWEDIRTHDTKHSVHLPTRCPRRRHRAEKQPQMVPQPSSLRHKSHCSALARPAPEARLPHLVLRGKRVSGGSPLPRSFSRVYTFIIALSEFCQHQHRTLLALISGPLHSTHPDTLQYLCCQLLLGLPPPPSHWQLSSPLGLALAVSCRLSGVNCQTKLYRQSCLL